MKNKKNMDFNDLPKENGFKVPEGYFENFPGKLKKRISEKTSTAMRQQRKNSFTNLFTNQLALAASLVAFALISYFSVHFILNIGIKEKKTIYSEVVENEIEDFDLELLIDIYSDGIFENNTDKDYESEIIDFLVAENIDLQSIVAEL